MTVLSKTRSPFVTSGSYRHEAVAVTMPRSSSRLTSRSQPRRLSRRPTTGPGASEGDSDPCGHRGRVAVLGGLGDHQPAGLEEPERDQHQDGQGDGQLDQGLSVPLSVGGPEQPPGGGVFPAVSSDTTPQPEF